MKRLVADIEANGLLREATQVWCIVAKDLETEEVFKFTPDNLEDGLELFSSYDMLIGHNFIGYDLPLLEKLYSYKYGGVVIDTLCVSKLFEPDRLSHSLDSYGTQFGRAKPVHEDWSQYSTEMLHRCSEDVEINVMLYNYQVAKAGDWNWFEALALEQDFLRDQVLQEEAMVDIDMEGAKKLVEQIDIGVGKIDEKLMAELPMKVKPYGTEVTKLVKKDGTYTKQITDWFDEGVLNVK